MPANLIVLAEGYLNMALKRLRTTHPIRAEITSYYGFHPGRVRTIDAVIRSHEIEIMYNPAAVCRAKSIAILEKWLLRVLDKIIDSAREPDHEPDKDEDAENDKKNQPPQEQQGEEGEGRGRGQGKDDGEANEEEDQDKGDGHEDSPRPLNRMNDLDRERLMQLLALTATKAGHVSDLDKKLRDLLGMAAGGSGGGDGTGSSFATETIITEGSYQMQWRRILEPYQGNVSERMRTRGFPNRRMPELVGIVAGKRRMFTQPGIMVVIDTSGSITTQDLQLISRECLYFKSMAEVTIVECDDRIRNAYQYRGQIKEVAGRGGTSFLPPLERNFLKKYHPDVVIYFTDGVGLAPVSPPIKPVVWCLIRDWAVSPAPYGQVVRYPSHSQQQRRFV